MTDRNVKIIFGLLSAGLLTSLLLKLATVPGGIILSGFFIGVMLIVGIVLGCLILSSVLSLIFNRASFLTLVLITTSISFTIFHYQLYSPKLTIRVPNGYTGEINLVLSNVENNMLTVDTNGIGYITKWTFNKTYIQPKVFQMDGQNLENNLVGFNSSIFFGKRTSCCIDGQEIQSLNFEIVPDDKIGEKQYYSTDLSTLVNKAVVLTK